MRESNIFVWFVWSGSPCLPLVVLDLIYAEIQKILKSISTTGSMLHTIHSKTSYYYYVLLLCNWDPASVSHSTARSCLGLEPIQRRGSVHAWLWLESCLWTTFSFWNHIQLHQVNSQAQFSHILLLIKYSTSSRWRSYFCCISMFWGFSALHSHLTHTHTHSLIVIYTNSHIGMSQSNPVTHDRVDAEII